MKTAILFLSSIVGCAAQSSPDGTTYKGHCIHFEKGRLVPNSRSCDPKTPSADEDIGRQDGAKLAMRVLREELQSQQSKGKNVDIAGMIHILDAIEKALVK